VSSPGVFGDRRLLAHQQAAHHAFHGGPDSQSVHAALQVRNHELLALDVRAFVLEVNVETVFLQPRIRDCMVICEARVIPCVLCFVQIAVGNYSLFDPALHSLELALCRANLRRGEINGLLAFQDLPVGLDRLPLQTPLLRPSSVARSRASHCSMLDCPWWPTLAAL